MKFDFKPNLDPLVKAIRSNKRFELVAELYKIADQVAPAVKAAGHTVTCGKGCAHCCKGSAIMLSQVEVKVIEKATGRTASKQSTAPENLMGTPRSFLNAANECSIYDSRPETCRVLTSIDSPTKCITEVKRDIVTIKDVAFDIAAELKRRQAAKGYTKMNNSNGAVDIRVAFP